MRLPLFKHDVPGRMVAFALALVAAASVVTGREKPSLQPVAAAPAQRAESARPAPEIDLAKLRRGEADAAPSDAFAPRSFAPAARRAPAGDAPRPAQQPPALPFTFFGRLTEGGRTEVYLMRGGELISIAAGRNIDHEYRVDAITETSIIFTHLPRKEKLSIELTGAKG